MHSQTLIVALLVIGCSGYSAWTLIPSAARRALAVMLLRLPLPGLLSRRLRKIAQATTGCGCDGCDRSELKAKAAASGTDKRDAQPITFHRRRR